MNQIKAIETMYKGYRFRSRLEARWAVFFDTLGIEWKYEDQGYERDIGIYECVGDPDSPTGERHVPNIARYLPDFFLPDGRGGGVFVEVKGDKDALKKNWEHHAQIHDFGGILPNFADSFRKNNAGLLLLSDIPEASDQKIYVHPIIQHYKGLVKSYAFFDGGHLAVLENSPFTRMFGLAPVHGLEVEENNWGIDTMQVHVYRHYPNVVKAYAAARSARFEHADRQPRYVPGPYL